MIYRIWNGWTVPGNADRYEALIADEIFPGIVAKAIPGLRGMELLRRDMPDEVEFTTIMYFESMDAIQAFMGGDPEVAYVPESARQVLKRYDERSRHCAVRVSG